jgi:hypothetical protein
MADDFDNARFRGRLVGEVRVNEFVACDPLLPASRRPKLMSNWQVVLSGLQ